MTDITQPNHRPLRVAFYGRVARDTDGTAMTSIDRQYEQCRRALPPGAIVAVFYDIGSDSAFRRRPGRRTVDGQTLRRDGGLDDLLLEARFPSRRYDYLTASGPDRLSRDAGRARDLLDRLRLAQVQPLFPDVALPGVSTVDMIDLLVSPWPLLGADGRRGRTRRGGS